MTLEDFFTLTEMRDGFTSPARVRELVFVMEREKDSVTKSSGDAIRQWAAVATSISATESRECIDLFLQLDGLSFINRWLMYAGTFNDNAKDGFVDESISGLLKAIDKLQVDSERSVSSGIWTTIENLLGHRSTKVQEESKALLEMWKPGETEISECKTDGNAEPCDNANGEKKLDGSAGQSDHDATSKRRPSAENCEVDPAAKGTEQMTGSSNIQPEKVEDEKAPVIDDENPLIENLNQANVEDTSPYHLLSSSQSGSVNKTGQDEDGPSAEVLTRGGFTANMGMRQSVDGQTGVLEAVKSGETAQRADKIENSKRFIGSEAIGRRVVDRKRSSAGLDYGIVDALAVARQVAQEVEREVVDRKERFCSSPSERDSGGGPGQAGSPESVQEGDQSSDSLSDRLPRQNSSSEASSDGDRSVLENQNAEPENSTPDMESSQVTDATQDPEDKTEKGFCAFDLNQEVCSDDMDRAENAISAHISVVSASKPAASFGVPSAPMQFEGILGWKGSAATSAFRPASPRSSIGDKVVNAERIDSRQKLSSLRIDLNVAESGDDKVTDLMLTMPIPVSSSLRSGESSVEVSSRRPEKLGLDLNRLGDDGEPSISYCRRGLPGFYHLNSRRSPSPASSSSSMQPSRRNIDLNDRPLTNSDFMEQGSYGSKIPQRLSFFGKSKQDPVISILGAKVEVNKKDHVSQTLPLLNGGNKGFETEVDAASITTAGGFLGMGPGNPYQHQHPPIWAFNGLMAGPAVSLAPALYHPGSSIPYMLDPRIVPAVHHPAGAVPAVPFSYPQAPAPFMMSMSAGPFALNGPYPGPGPMGTHLDLNSGIYMSDGANRESTAILRQFFVPDHVRPTEEHIRGGFPSSSGGSGIGAKRKEPDGGWEPYPISFRQQQPPRT